MGGAKRFIREAFASISTTPTEHSATGAFTGWIRFCGGRTSSIRNESIRPAVAQLADHRFTTSGEQTTDAPDHQLALFEFEDFSATWEHRRFADNNAEKGENVGCHFYGTKGTFHQGWQDGWRFYPANEREPQLHEPPQLHQPDSQNIRELWTDLLECITTGRRPVCDIELAHRSTNMSLLGMLSLKLGRSLEWDGEQEQIINDPEANAMLRRDYRAPWIYPS